MIDFVYVKFLTSTLKIIIWTPLFFSMDSEKNKPPDNATSDRNYKIVEFHDYFFNKKNKKSALKNYGEKTAQLHSFFFDYLKGYNIPIAYLKKEGKKNLKLIETMDLPFRIKIINAADSRTSKIFSLKLGTQLQLPIMEYHYGDSKDSMISEGHLISFDLCTYDDLKFINRLCSKLNVILKSFFDRRNTSLVELTCIFGKFESKIILIGDFSPASLMVIDNENSAKLPDPFKIETPAQMKKYTDYLLNLTNGD